MNSMSDSLCWAEHENKFECLCYANKLQYARENNSKIDIIVLSLQKFGKQFDVECAMVFVYLLEISKGKTTTTKLFSNNVR